MQEVDMSLNKCVHKFEVFIQLRVLKKFMESEVDV
jgi:hypothetical protein